MLEDLLNDLEGTAHWRRRVMGDHPDDQRNETAAKLLERLKDEIQSKSDSAIAREIEEVEEELLRLSDGNTHYDLSHLSEECSEYRRRIGFSTFPRDGDEYLEGLLEIYKANRARAERTTDDDDDLRQGVSPQSDNPKPLGLATSQSLKSLGLVGAGKVTGTWTEATEPLFDEAGQALYPVGGASPVTPRVEVVLANLPNLPIQGPGPHFEFSKDGTIDFVPPTALDREGNNVERLRRLHPALRELVRELSKALATGNAPHAILAGRLGEYRKRIDQPLETVDFSLLYVEGVRLANGERAAREEIARGDLPPLAEAERETIQTILQLHGTFILNTAAGLELIAAEERYQRRPKAEREYRAAAIDFAQSLQNQPAIITPNAAAFVLGAAEQINQGANPERSGVVGTSVIQNVAVVLAAGAVVAALPIVGNAIAGANGLVIGGLTSLLASESLKKSKPFATVIAPLIAKLDEAARTDFPKIKNFLISIEGKVRDLAKKNNNFHWLSNVIDRITRIDGYINLNLLRKITELSLSSGTVGILQSDNIVFVGDLVRKTEVEFLQFPGCERRMLNEIRENLASVGLHLGMEIEWPPENIEYAIEQLKIWDQGHPG